MKKFQFCIDLEGVFFPEMWPHIAMCSGIESLNRTTREEPDYYSLVDFRIETLSKHKITCSDINLWLQELRPFDGAHQFLQALANDGEVLIVSDAFQPMVNHALDLLDNPRIQCNQFYCENDVIVSAQYVRANNKADALTHEMLSRHQVVAVGDAFNDIPMLKKAHHGFLFSPSDLTRQAVANDESIVVATEYTQILRWLNMTNSHVQLAAKESIV